MSKAIWLIVGAIVVASLASGRGAYHAPTYEKVADEAEAEDAALSGGVDYVTRSDWVCTDDCSGHEAGYDWAQDNGIDDPDDCNGDSESFIEGCKTWAFEQAPPDPDD